MRGVEKMRKEILKLCIAIAIIAMIVMPVSAIVTQPLKSNGIPFDKLWDAALDLQAQINALIQKVNKIESSPRPCINCMCPTGQYVTGFDSKGSLICSASLKPYTWVWSSDGWSGWEHSWSTTGTPVGPNTEYGPVMVTSSSEGLHGEHGTDTNILGGTTQSSVWKTFTDPTGTGWNSITFNGLLTASDVPNGRWMTIEINNNQVFGGTASQSPPGNGVPFEIKRSFTQSPTVKVKISNGQSPAWGPRFAIHYYSVKLSLESDTTTMKAQSIPFVIPNGKDLITNATQG